MPLSFVFSFSLWLVLVRPILLIDLTSACYPPNAHATVFLHLALNSILIVNGAFYHAIQRDRDYEYPRQVVQCALND